MTSPSILVDGLALTLCPRADLESAYREALRQLDVAQQAARQSAHAIQILVNRIRATDAYAAGLASTLPDMAEPIADLRALLAGNMH